MVRLMVSVAGIGLLALCGARLNAADRGADKADGRDSAHLAPFVHVVIFELKKDAPEGEADALIADAHEMLGKVPSVRGLRAGKPAEQSNPNFPKREFQVGLLVLFENAEGLEAYNKHPLHLKYVEKHGKYIEREKLGIYDFVEPKK